MSPRLANVISAHSWSPDESTLALSPNSSEIYVYRASQGVLQKQCTLREHSQLVLDIHWNRQSSFASCSHDSSAYVWTWSGVAWKPELVFTRLRLAALCLRWNPSGDAFAIGSSEMLICICHKDKRNNCWSARLIRKCHSSSVTAVAWSPCGTFLASTSTDGQCMLFSMGSTGAVKRDNSAFGTVLMDIQAGSGWGLGLSWSPSGEQLAIASHGCTVQFVSGLHKALASSGAAESQQRQLLRLEQLPLRCVEHLSETTLVGAGFDGEVYLFERMSGGKWAQSATLSPTAALSEAGGGQSGKLSAAFRDKLALFKGHSSQESNGRGFKEPVAEQREAPHSNVIVGMNVFKLPDGTPTGRFTTAGWDGRVLEWQVDMADTIKAIHARPYESIKEGKTESAIENSYCIQK